jgi:predicted nuclease of predicted toxin-antitoxin system
VRFLLDANLSPRVVALLRAAGLDAEHVREHAKTPSLVLLRTNGMMPPDDHAALLVANLPGLSRELDDGAVIVIERERIRVRQLPLLPHRPEQRGH